MEKPTHLMISTIGDMDPYRLSAEARCEGYVQIADPEHERYIKWPHHFSIVYVHSSVGQPGLQWCLDSARESHRQLFVVVDPDDEAWGNVLESWEGRSLSNTYFHERSANESYDHIDQYLATIVEAWRARQ